MAHPLFSCILNSVCLSLLASIEVGLLEIFHFPVAALQTYRAFLRIVSFCLMKACRSCSKFRTHQIYFPSQKVPIRCFMILSCFQQMPTPIQIPMIQRIPSPKQQFVIHGW